MRAICAISSPWRAAPGIRTTIQALIGATVVAGGMAALTNMTSPHGSLDHGQEALPVITTRIQLLGPATITRDSSEPFRIAEVSPTGDLTLTTEVALTNGSADGDGGAILNYGAVTLTRSSLSDNTATGNGGGLANADTPSGTAPVPDPQVFTGPLALPQRLRKGTTAQTTTL